MVSNRTSLFIRIGLPSPLRIGKMLYYQSVKLSPENSFTNRVGS